MKPEATSAKHTRVTVRIASREFDPEPSIQGAIAIQLLVALALEYSSINKERPLKIDDAYE